MDPLKGLGFGKPLGALGGAIVIGQDEVGNPIYQDALGRTYSVGAQPQRSRELERLLGLPDDPQTPAGFNPLALLSGFTAPGNALRGQMMTVGDVWDTAGTASFGGAAMPAPANALRMGAMRSTDDVAERGAQIMDMLKAGRGSDVTDAMLDMGDATKNARLNEWLYANYDLPMDAGSRASRKAEMGFDADLYHGTDAAFPYFREGDGSNTGVSAPAVFLSDSRKVAGTYGDTVLDLTARMEQPISVDFDGRSVGYFGEKRFTPSELTKEMASIRGDVRKGYLDPDSDLRYDLEGAGFDYNYNTDIDSIEMRNVVDSASMFGGDVANNYAIFDPQNIRLRTARFDPRLSHLRNLSAGVVGAATVGAASEEEIDAYLRSIGAM